ncbi:DUF3566 domain-containing protein [Rhodococcus sp. 077-4]|uniref:DUF3566 domain-containing protein n=1 Tax=Rhodococcus sp. 077-4 TaxID=2789271 RepID=UPI0039F5F445
MSTPNRPGSRPGPSGGPDSRDAARTEQSAPPEGARPGSRPQPATRPAPAAGRGPAPQAGRPPVRPAPGAPNGPARPAQGPPPQRPPAQQGPPPQAPRGAREQGPPAPRPGQAPVGPPQAQSPQTPGRPPGPGQQPAGRPNGGPPPNGQPPQRQAPAGQPARQAAPQASAVQSPAATEAVRVSEGSAESAVPSDATRPPQSAPAQDQAGPAATQAMPAQQADGPQGSPGTPPWQRGAGQRPAPQGAENRQQPQNQPQTNLSGRGAALPPNGEFERSARTTAEPIQTESTENKTERREAARSKAAVIDGPTRHIERKDLAKDMPDLSAVRHPEPSPSERAAPAAITAVPSADGDPLRATIQIRKIDPWSTLKIALVIAVSLFFVWMVAVGLLYAVLDGMGVWERLNSAFTEIVNESGDGGLVSAGQVFGYAAVIGVINVVLFTALTTIGAFIYNLSSDLVGGVEVTLADRD